MKGGANPIVGFVPPPPPIVVRGVPLHMASSGAQKRIDKKTPAPVTQVVLMAIGQPLSMAPDRKLLEDLYARGVHGDEKQMVVLLEKNLCPVSVAWMAQEVDDRGHLQEDMLSSSAKSGSGLWGCTLEVHFPSPMKLSVAEPDEETDEDKDLARELSSTDHSAHRNVQDYSTQKMRVSQGRQAQEAGSILTSACSPNNKRCRDVFIKVDGDEGFPGALAEERTRKSPKSKIWSAAEQHVPPASSCSPLRKVMLHSIVNEQIASPVAKFLSPSATSLCAEARFFGDF
jgi:hypothetical protein